MIIRTEYLKIKTKKRKDIVHITDLVEKFVKDSKVKEGFVLVSSMHITSGILVNDYEEGLWQDIFEWLEKLAPERVDYKHHTTGEDNGDAHLKRILINHQVIVPITDSKLDLGVWERIFYFEFDGMREKRIILKVFGE
ncbi:MAG: secondary thiamine-phosphate synthase enzyme YjbQ [candidate division WOR-3 bacterium]